MPLGGRVFSKKATLRGIGDVRGKLPFRLNELSFNFRRKLLIFIAQISWSNLSKFPDFATEG